MPELAVLIPTRGRPGNIEKVISAWDFTNAWDVADMILIADADDPAIEGYRALVSKFNAEVPPDQGAEPLQLIEMPIWQPMVHKLNEVAAQYAGEGGYFALGFAGDDHLPQTMNWAKRYLAVLHELRTGMVYSDDGYQGAKLSTEWAVTADAVRALGRMVPADVEHMYCDNSILDLYTGAGAVRHLPEVRIEHMHPYAGKAETDEQYQRVNARDQYSKDRQAYESWRHSPGFELDVIAVRQLRPGLPESRPEAPGPRRSVGSGPRPVVRRGKPVQRSGPSVPKSAGRLPFPRHFRNVRGATPDDIGVTLADFAAQVPADQEIVELGVFQGRTALLMAWGASQGHNAHVTAIDPWDTEGNVYDPPFTDADSRVWAHYNVETLGYSDKIRLIQAFSHDVAADWNLGPELPELNNRPVGLLFVDGDHTREGARRDIESWAPHLAEGARIAIDDYGHPDWPGVGEAVDELVSEGLLMPIEIYHDRLAVTRLNVLTVPPVLTTNITAITSEGVSTSPGTSLTVPGQVAAEPEPIGPLAVEDPGQPDTEVSTEAPGLRVLVSAGELEGVPGGTEIEDLNLAQLKALAKTRGIVLGYRKDKKNLILQALQDGR